jgi:dolichol-phosphate mannosyltransferase
VDAGRVGGAVALSSTPLLSIVLPVYNEGPNIERVLRELARFAPPSREIFIVYDFPADDTLPAARRVQADMPEIALVLNTRGRGVLGAMRTGLEVSHGRFVLITMADASDDYADLPAMLRAGEEGAALVAASRYVSGGSQHGGPLVKRTLSRLAGLLLHAIAGMPIHDPTSNYKLYSRELIDRVDIESVAGFELALELAVKAHRLGLPMSEVPTTWRDRTAGESRFQLRKWLPHYLRWFRYGIATRFLPRSREATHGS